MKTILVPLDGSKFAEAALASAIALARRSGARVTLAGVHRPMIPPPGAFGAPAPDWHRDEQAREILRTYLDRQQQYLLDQEGIASDTALLEGQPAEQITGRCQAGADLVVLASHGRGGISRFWLGSTTDALVRQLDTPVLVVRPREDEDADQRRLTPEFHRVLIPLDGSPEGERIFDTVLGVVGTTDVHYTLLRVATPLHPLLLAVASDAEAKRDTAEQQELAQAYIAEATARFTARGADAKGAVRLSIDPAREILAAAAEHDAQLIAISTHGRGPVGRLMIGSVADKVLRGASTPVLLQRVTDGGA